MTVQQSTERAVIDWQTYNLGGAATVNYQQPDANAVILNRVTSASASQIDGAINANGTVIISNANGVTFGKGAEVNAGAVVATTLNQSNDDFMKGSTTWQGNNTGAVVNHGKITATNAHGYVALLAPEVRNEGYVVANQGPDNSVVMASAEKVTLDFQGDKLVNVSVDKAVLNGLIENKHAIITNGGQVILSTGAANDLLNTVINNTGTISASSIVSNGGTIELVADTVVSTGKIEANAGKNGQGGQVIINASTNATVSGEISAQGGHVSGNGGKIAVAADTITLANTSHLNTKAGLAGNGGQIQVVSNKETSVAGTLTSTGGIMRATGAKLPLQPL
jgi:filamentous hemagglutinin family protein